MKSEQPEVGAAVRHVDLAQSGTSDSAKFGTVAGYSKAYAVIHIRYDNGDSASYPYPDVFESGELSLD